MAHLSPSRRPLRILADDLTGALDSAAAFGAGVPVHLGRPPASGTGAAVEVIATATRDVAPAKLDDLLAPCLPWLAGAGVAFKKVDSLLRGNTFDEVDRIARALGHRRVLFAPAFPSQGRVTRGGWQRLRRAGQADEAIGAVSIVEAMHRRGWAASVDAPATGDAAAAVWVPDVQDDADLQRIAARIDALGGPPWLWVGSAGLAQALAGPAAAAHPAASSADPPAEPAFAPPMLVSASHHPVSRRQWAVLTAARPAALTVRHGDAAALQQVLRTGAAATGPDPAPLLLDLSCDTPLTPDEAAEHLAHRLAIVAAQAPRPRRLVVVGGDTLLALCHASGAHGLVSAIALPRPGWGSARLQGGGWDGVRCETRSGAFGGEADLLDVLNDVLR